MTCSSSDCRCRGDCPERSQTERSQTERSLAEWSAASMARLFATAAVVVVPPDTRAPEGAKTPLASADDIEPVGPEWFEEQPEDQVARAPRELPTEPPPEPVPEDPQAEKKGGGGGGAEPENCPCACKCTCVAEITPFFIDRLSRASKVSVATSPALEFTPGGPPSGDHALTQAEEPTTGRSHFKPSLSPYAWTTDDSEVSADAGGGATATEDGPPEDEKSNRRIQP